ncbi:MAG: Ribonuclease HII [Candidatus Saccharicenans subterraneus]|uniref:Ribonuclease HII n=1 Tax=Candidatus Saccharicenans subterraneus TaxID=2508984 RepID=A0A3E2BJ62_9BACT|nr:MAG: Ribonuclease HII [Candidatus Saccharicenans subterraneum]
MIGFKTEKALLQGGRRHLAGLDEVGRGSLFGPVVAVAVIFPPDFFLKKRPSWTGQVIDSKLLSPTKRLELSKRILEAVADLGLGYATHLEIDRLNIYRASQLAMVRSLEELSLKPDAILVDGHPLKGIDYFQMAVPQGDRKIFSIAAASIVAKVFRDELMDALDGIFPEYQLGRNRGYATEDHFQALEKNGPCALHRRSFRLYREKVLIK